jgi:hypothetical protein
MRGAVLPEGAGPGRARKAWLLSRALYRCKHVPLGHVGAGQRRAVLRNILLAWAPFDDTEYRVALLGDSALAFGWDRSAVRALLATAAAPQGSVVWPESMLREPMANDGLRVVPCLDGIEAQAWQAQALVASRWWPKRPEPEEAQGWLRSLGAISNASDALPTGMPVAWLRRPWMELQGAGDLLSTLSRLERIAVGSAMVGFAALTAAQAHQALAAYEDRHSLQRELERGRLEAGPVLAARDRAEATGRELQGLALQSTGVLPLELLQHLADVLPARGATLKELELSGQKLRMSLELAPGVQRSAFVKDLQAGGWLTQVAEARETTNRGWIVFDAELAGHRPPAWAARTAAAASAPSQPVLPAASQAAQRP